MSQINTTLKAIKAQGGCTFAATGERLNPTKGWQVSTQDLYIMPLYKLTKKIFEQRSANHCRWHLSGRLD